MMDTIFNYMKDHIALTVVLAVVLVLIVALIVLLAVEISRSKKRAKVGGEAPALREDPVSDVPEENSPEVPEEVCTENGEETENGVEQPGPAPTQAAAEEPEPQREEQTPQARQEEKASAKNEIPGYVFVPVKKDRAEKETAEKEAPMKQEKKSEKKATPAAVKAPAKPAKKETVGKWIVYEEDRGGFGFRLIASNGEEMLKSSSPYASLSSAKSGIKTYQDNIAAGRLEVVETKKGNFFVQLNNASKRLLATSADYKTRSSCENALASIKRWAATTVIVVEDSDEDDKK